MAGMKQLLPPTNANFEYVLTSADESFLWRQDNYPWERNVWNFHPEIEIHLVTNTGGVAFVGDYIGEFDPGHLAFVGSNLPHDWVTQVAPGELIMGRDIVIQFDPEKIIGAAAILPELAGLNELLERAKRGLAFTGQTRDRASDLILEMGEQTGAARLASFVALLALLQKSDEYIYLSSQAFSPELQYGSLNVLQNAFAYIFRNLAEDIKLEDLSEMSGMSESSFSRFFKKNSGLSFTDHVRKLRISRATKLLTETNMPITDICYEVGFRNLSNFNRTFLQLQHISPSKYRQLALQRRNVAALAAHSASS